MPGKKSQKRKRKTKTKKTKEINETKELLLNKTDESVSKSKDQKRTEKPHDCFEQIIHLLQRFGAKSIAIANILEDDENEKSLLELLLENYKIVNTRPKTKQYSIQAIKAILLKRDKNICLFYINYHYGWESFIPERLQLVCLEGSVLPEPEQCSSSNLNSEQTAAVIISSLVLGQSSISTRQITKITESPTLYIDGKTAELLSSKSGTFLILEKYFQNWQKFYCEFYLK